MVKILLVEDDEPLAGSLKSELEHENYTVDMVHRGDDAIDFLSSTAYELVILDWNLPAHSGIEICQHIRGKALATAVLMLTANSGEKDKVAGLDCGADDYLTKPFSMPELSARVRALLRRPPAYTPNDRIAHGPYVLYPKKFIVEKLGERIPLQPQEFALLEFLFRHPNDLFSIEAILQRVWPTDSDASEQSLRGCIKRIRKKLNDPDIIKNVHGVGYCLEHK